MIRQPHSDETPENRVRGDEHIERWVVSDRVLALDLKEHAWALGIAGGRIAVIEGADALRQRVAQRQLHDSVDDYRQRPIVPGWVNAHTHLAMAPLRGVTTRAARSGNVVADVFFQIERNLSAADVHAFATQGAYESLLLGVTEVWDHYYFGSAVADALLSVGLTGTVAPTLQDIAGPGRHDWETGLATTESIAKDTKYRQHHVRAAIGLHATDTVSDRLFGLAARLAQMHHLPVHMHLMQNLEEVEASFESRDGQAVERAIDLATHGPLLAAHGLHLTGIDIERLASLNTLLAFCPLSQLQFGYLGPLLEWVAAGGDWALGTDCVASNDALDVQRELPLVGGLPALAASFSSERYALLETPRLDASRRVLSQAIEAERKRQLNTCDLADPSTLLPAAWGLSLPGPPRGIQVGAVANLLVLDSDNPALFPEGDLPRALCYTSLSSALYQVIAAGRPLGEAGNLNRSLLTSTLYRQRLDEARRRGEELLSRSSL